MQVFHVVSFHLVSSLQRSCEMFGNTVTFNGKELLAPRQTSKLEDNAFSVVHDYLFKILFISGGRSSTRNMWTWHAVVIGTHLPRKSLIQKIILK
jgi:hypothetical protein